MSITGIPLCHGDVQYHHYFSLMCSIARLGIIADVQYADKDDDAMAPGEFRRYRHSLHKLQTAISDFNAMDNLHGVLHLGDIIDEGRF